MVGVITIDNLFDRRLFDEMVSEGYVRIQTHPTEPLVIANYSEKAQFDRVWNDVTLQCRGLIFEPEFGTVVARPYRKFFNYGDDTNTGALDFDAPVTVTDKLDGSLGISYFELGEPAIATRGSFASDQAQHATKLLREKYPDFRPLHSHTYLWEIVYPENRIVVDYGKQDDLILHGVIHINTGKMTVDRGWPGPVAETFAYETLAAALAAEPRANAEGLVVRYLDTGLMVKIKQEDYVALHRIITGLNARTVWEWLGDGHTVGDLCATIPDDFHGWVEDLATELEQESSAWLYQAGQAFDRITSGLPDSYSRKDFAEQAKNEGELTSYLFMLLDGQDKRARELAWRAVRPSGARSMVNHSEAVA